LENRLWEKVSFRCQKEGRVKEYITNTIRNWATNPYKSKLLNSLWKIVPGFLIWSIWKEWNRCIFKDQCTPIEVLWSNFCINLQETLMLQTWHEEDFPTLPQEQNIWTNWNLRIKQVQEKHNESYSHQHTPSKWIPLPHKMIQLNFDGSSKGKPSRAGYGGIFTDHKDKPLLIFLGSIGWDTNNSTELEGLWQGLLLAQHHGFFPLVIEGDCQILINMAK